MKKQCLIVLVTVATMVIGLGSLASVQGSDVVAIPGTTVVRDSQDDFLLRRCDPEYAWVPCSLPPSTEPPPPTLPGYFDIKNARITQTGRGFVDLSIKVYEPIPAVPYISPDTPFGFVSYIWQFQGGCVGTNPEPGNKGAISIVWRHWEDNDTWEWRADWYVITNCEPRELDWVESIPDGDWNFTWDGVKVRVPLDYLLDATGGTGTLRWHAAVRRIPFIYHPEGYPYFPNTAAVDYAPDVVEFLDCGVPPQPPCAKEHEPFATWVPR